MKPLRVHPKFGKGYGWRQPLYPSHHFPLYMAHIDPAALPNKVDLRPECPPIYDQGALGSCTANAWAGLAEFITLKMKLTDFIPSRLFIYYQERLLEGDTADDTGASLADGAHVTSISGCPHEDLCPYDISTFAQKPSDAAYADGLKHLVLAPQQVHQDLNSIKAVLANGYPVPFGFTVFESFESDAVASTGIVPMPGKHEQVLGGHATDIVGYLDDVKRAIVRNSWGTSWGMGGYFQMPYAYLINARLASDFWTASKIM
jgi:C1A family cysteine protease